MSCPICGDSNFICGDLQSRTLSIEEVRDAFKAHGLTVTHWAERHGINRASVYQVLYKKHRSYHGVAHAIAVLLRIKNGDLNEFFNTRHQAHQPLQVAQ